MKLRKWQNTCIERALDHYRFKKHFLCLATPGAGKTTMAAELASRLLISGKIDFILCFAPSLIIVEGLEHTFEQRIGRRFDGRIGAIGGTYTYQSMRNLGSRFWSIFDTNRVLVVFDEIHHCAGNDLGGTNSWGQEILVSIQHKAAYTLALTGTPWRSDNGPIVLAEYSDPDKRIQCNYSYGLEEAVSDQVCRRPSIVLINNSRMKVKEGEAELEYDCLTEMFQRSDVRYQQLLNNDAALRFCLSLGCQKLDHIRKNTPEAGGLVVASSVSHAEQITHVLRTQFGKSVSIVTYKHKDASLIIDRYRKSVQEWIVSVGMISEGTDIPRLQVCCHLSRITTELYFRQVLGRVLRVTNGSSQHAWMYTFAEPQLVEFAERLDNSLPFKNTLHFEEFTLQGPAATDLSSSNDSHEENSATIEFLNNCVEEHESSPTDLTGPFVSDLYSLECLGAFRERIIEFFENEIKLPQS